MEETMKDYEKELTESYRQLEEEEETAPLTEEEEKEEGAWAYLKEIKASGGTVKMKVKEAVEAGVVGTVEGIRAFIPISKISVSHVEKTDDYVGKTIEAEILTLDKAQKKLVLSGRAVEQKKEAAKRSEKIKELKVGQVVDGVVETLQSYGAFVKMENGLTGLVHVSQIANRRIKSPAEVLKEGQNVRAKIVKLEGEKISLSVKALEEVTGADEEKVDTKKYSDSGSIGTSLGSLLKNIKLD
ncbi:MAG: S1 RNA-binding domain-containing protein [Lachnospiraceae bacterium]|nr:S1 RNA-binding domain-containing protein [Lachnospiraceae bacterium]